MNGGDGSAGVVESMDLLHVEDRGLNVASSPGLCARVEEEDDSQTGLGNKGEGILIESKDVDECPTS